MLNLFRINQADGLIEFNEQFSNGPELLKCNKQHEFRLNVGASNPVPNTPGEMRRETKVHLLIKFDEFIPTLPPSGMFHDDPSRGNVRKSMPWPSGGGESPPDAQGGSNHGVSPWSENTDSFEASWYLGVLLVVALVLFVVAIILLALVMRRYARKHRTPDFGRGKYLQSSMTPAGISNLFFLAF